VGPVSSSPGLPLAAYRLAWLAAAPVVGWLLRRGARADPEGRYVAERWGRRWRSDVRGPLWVHCASVGEVTTACPVVRELLGRGRRAVLLTTNTPTGARTVRRLLGGRVAQAYLPLDTRRRVAAFLDRFAPAALLVCETEIWPELYHQCHARGIPVALFNARLTPRTLRAPRWVRSLYAEALRPVRAVLARTDADAARFRDLGAVRVRVVGNLKWAWCAPAPAGAPPVDPPYWLGVSTHEGEEVALARIQMTLPEHAPRLVLMPRHPERGGQIAETLRRAGIPVSRRSLGEPAVGPVHLADTLGEAMSFMGHAELVFMGGSLVPAGGHNLLEPARLGLPVVVGPHMEDFAEETRALLSAGAVVQVRDAAEAQGVVRGLLADGPVRAELGRAARRVVAEHAAGVVRDYVSALERAGVLP